MRPCPRLASLRNAFLSTQSPPRNLRTPAALQKRAIVILVALACISFAAEETPLEGVGGYVWHGEGGGYTCQDETDRNQKEDACSITPSAATAESLRQQAKVERRLEQHRTTAASKKAQ